MANDAGNGSIGDAGNDATIDNGVSGDGGNADANVERAPDPYGATNPEATVKRGRGRPPGSGKQRTESATGNAASGRPSEGSGPRTSKASASLDLDVFAKQLMAAHQMLALLLKEESILISEAEAKSLAKALKNVLAFHSISMSPQSLAYLQLAGCAAIIYGPKIMLVNAKSKMRREQARQAAQQRNQPSIVVPEFAGGSGTMKFN